jgi:hypothetical protein
MVSWQKNGDDVEFVVEAESPLLYLDHWAIRRFSENPTHGSRFLTAFKNRGTVMFSLMNVTEIARDASPTRAREISRFLEALGEHWIPMTIDPIRIVRAEESGTTSDGIHPCVSAGFLSDPAFAQRLTTGNVSLSHVVDLTRGPNGDAIRQDSARQELQLLNSLQDWRNAYTNDHTELDTKFPVVPFVAERPMRTIYHGLARLTITDGFKLTDGHVRDLFHTLAAVRCAEMVTLDAHWVNQVQKLRLPTDFVKLYSEANLEQFLSDLEASPATRS